VKNGGHEIEELALFDFFYDCSGFRLCFSFYNALNTAVKKGVI